jgi:hypothetical protein
MLNIPKAAQAADIYQRKRCAGPGSLRCFVPSFHGQEENRHLLIQISSPVLWAQGHLEKSAKEKVCREPIGQ